MKATGTMNVSMSSNRTNFDESVAVGAVFFLLGIIALFLNIITLSSLPYMSYTINRLVKFTMQLQCATNVFALLSHTFFVPCAMVFGRTFASPMVHQISGSCAMSGMASSIVLEMTMVCTRFYAVVVKIDQFKNIVPYSHYFCAFFPPIGTLIAFFISSSFPCCHFVLNEKFLFDFEGTNADLFKLGTLITIVLCGTLMITLYPMIGIKLWLNGRKLRQKVSVLNLNSTIQKQEIRACMQFALIGAFWVSHWLIFFTPKILPALESFWTDTLGEGSHYLVLTAEPIVYLLFWKELRRVTKNRILCRSLLTDLVIDHRTSKKQPIHVKTATRVTPIPGREACLNEN